MFWFLNAKKIREENRQLRKNLEDCQRTSLAVIGAHEKLFLNNLSQFHAAQVKIENLEILVQDLDQLAARFQCEISEYKDFLSSREKEEASSQTSHCGSDAGNE